ncbi:MAG: helix-turn-helix domain-containing protein [Acidobacteria bacterium]|nr:helix-turn-helix domain-containing protein [Acidobacteriota bacterium]
MSESSLTSSEQIRLNSGLPNPGMVIGAPAPREVVRCASCMLVQFRTLSDLCRRCDGPLPRPQVEIEPAAAEPQPQPTFGILPGVKHIEPLEVRGKTLPSFALGPRLRELRECKNLTQAQIARKAHVPRTYVSRIEHCHLLPGLGVVERLAEALEVEVLELLPHPNGTSQPAVANDPYWNALVRYFRLLQDTQRSQILARVRLMIRSPNSSAA